MIIRKQQFEAFERGLARDFVRRVASAILEDDAGEWVLLPGGSDWIQVSDLPSSTLMDMVSTGIKRAARYGFDQGEDILAFVSLMFSFAPNFDEQPAINQTLTSADIDDQDRIELVAEMTSEQEWDEVEDAYDEWAWQIKTDLSQ